PRRASRNFWRLTPTLPQKVNMRVNQRTSSTHRQQLQAVEHIIQARGFTVHDEMNLHLVPVPAVWSGDLENAQFYNTAQHRWVSRYISLDKEEAKTELEKYQKRWWQKKLSPPA